MWAGGVGRTGARVSGLGPRYEESCSALGASVPFIAFLSRGARRVIRKAHVLLSA